MNIQKKFGKMCNRIVDEKEHPGHRIGKSSDTPGVIYILFVFHLTPLVFTQDKTE